MVLFKYSTTSAKTFIITIYIPLWSYSNEEICDTEAAAIQIYIPLWSYSNCNAWKSSDIYRRFTFHYGPIQMRKIHQVTGYGRHYLHSTMVLFKFKFLLRYSGYTKFTFHYGPIQISCRNVTLIMKSNLHSTMVLFKYFF